jgi:transposase
VKVKQASRYEPNPNVLQRILLAKHAGAAWFAYNWGLQQRIELYQRTGKGTSYVEQNRELNRLKKTAYLWMYGVSQCAPQEALRDLDRVFPNFFRGRKVGFPRFRKKGGARRPLPVDGRYCSGSGGVASQVLAQLPLHIRNGLVQYATFIRTKIYNESSGPSGSYREFGGKGRLWRSEVRGRKTSAGRGRRKQPRQVSLGYLSRSCRTVKRRKICL